jgi:hypothetical protein
MENCKICFKEFKNLKALSSHFNSKHKLSSNEYYDVFLLKEGEGKCKICENPTSFRNLNKGYLDNCSIECRDKNESINKGYWKGKKQTEDTIKKRIKNTNQVLKEQKRKETTLKKFNVDNPSKNSEISNKISLALKGRKIKRTNEWQKNIITAKKKNGTIKHSQETKEKITNSLNIFHQKNIDREKYITNSSNTKHLTGWYKKLHFRSSLELSFLINNQNVNFESCENKLYGIVYIIDGKSKIYYPDFTDGQFIYEIKPYSLLNYKNNNLKIKLGYEKYSNNFKLITEKESPYVSKKIIEELIKLGVIILSKSSENKFKKYKY